MCNFTIGRISSVWKYYRLLVSFSNPSKLDVSTLPSWSISTWVPRSDSTYDRMLASGLIRMTACVFTLSFTRSVTFESKDLLCWLYLVACYLNRAWNPVFKLVPSKVTITLFLSSSSLAFLNLYCPANKLVEATSCSSQTLPTVTLNTAVCTFIFGSTYWTVSSYRWEWI